jgi:hypothetical protein
MLEWLLLSRFEQCYSYHHSDANQKDGGNRQNLAITEPKSGDETVY